MTGVTPIQPAMKAWCRAWVSMVIPSTGDEIASLHGQGVVEGQRPPSAVVLPADDNPVAGSIRG